MILVVTLYYAIALGISIWLIVLFVLLCIRVKAILITAHDLQEYRNEHGFAYRERTTLTEN
jgi:hypothetical protein